MARALKVGHADLEATGLGFKNRAGRLQDFFRARILFPIMDERGRVIGFGGRKLPEGDGPKYQNSRDNVLYNKSKVLYGLNWAKADAVNHGEVVICEGYTDVIGFARAGIPRAVATCGTALTEDHVRTLKRFTRRLVLAYDADDAGQAAADRVYAWEQAHDIEVAVVALPPGSDPDELARSEPETLHRAVEQAQPFLAFRVDRVLGAADLGSVEGRARAAAAALEVVAEHPDPLVRDQYVKDVADRCRIEASVLRSRLEEVRRRPRPAREGAAAGGPSRRARSDVGTRRTFADGEPLPEEPPEWHDDAPPPDRMDRDPSGHRPHPATPQLRDGVETEALRLAVHHPDVAERYLNEALFSHPTVRAAYIALRREGSVPAAVEGATPEVAALLTRLVVETSEAEDADVLSRLTTEVGRQVLAELEAEARTAEDPLSYSQPIGWLKLNLDQLRSSKPEVETLELLLDWLGDRRRVTDQG